MDVYGYINIYFYKYTYEGTINLAGLHLKTFDFVYTVAEGKPGWL